MFVPVSKFGIYSENVHNKKLKLQFNSLFFLTCLPITQWLRFEMTYFQQGNKAKRTLQNLLTAVVTYL